jgi:NAD(P)-dependent dehydrogenase (short-subunit alcohol dehydrogenase family)
MGRLDGRIAVVTGASRGAGQGIALALGEEGATVYAGRAVAALAADPGVGRRSGQTLAAGDLARAYGFTDVDGRQPTAYPIDQ